MLKNRHVLITGVTSGIGLETTTLLLKKGSYVHGISRRTPKFQHSKFLHYPCDLSIAADLPHLVKKLPKIDILICNAGVGCFGYLEQLSISDMQYTFNVNLMSHVILCKLLIAQFKKQKQGDILFIGSKSGLQGDRQSSIYSASKFALRGFAQSLKEECRYHNIRVCILQPGMVRTPFFEHLHFEPESAPSNAISPTQIAKTLVHILQSPTSTLYEEVVLSPLKKQVRHKNICSRP